MSASDWGNANSRVSLKTPRTHASCMAPIQHRWRRSGDDNLFSTAITPLQSSPPFPLPTDSIASIQQDSLGYINPPPIESRLKRYSYSFALPCSIPVPLVALIPSYLNIVSNLRVDWLGEMTPMYKNRIIDRCKLIYSQCKFVCFHD